jgi:hypothetical protein
VSRVFQSAEPDIIEIAPGAPLDTLFQSDFSMSVRFQATAIDVNSSYFVLGRQDGFIEADFFFYAYLSTGGAQAFEAWIADTGFNYSYSGTDYIVGLFPLNSWNTIGFSYNATSGVIKLYLNGEEVGASIETLPGGFTQYGSLPFLLGKDPGYGNGNGPVEDLRMWNRELSEAEFATVHGGGDVATGLVGWWKLCGDDPEPDSAGSNDAIVTGTTVGAASPNGPCSSGPVPSPSPSRVRCRQRNRAA